MKQIGMLQHFVTEHLLTLQFFFLQVFSAPRYVADIQAIL
jgi:hypothetical protein